MPPLVEREPEDDPDNLEIDEDDEDTTHHNINNESSISFTSAGDYSTSTTHATVQEASTRARRGSRGVHAAAIEIDDDVNNLNPRRMTTTNERRMTRKTGA